MIVNVQITYLTYFFICIYDRRCVNYYSVVVLKPLKVVSHLPSSMNWVDVEVNALIKKEVYHDI